jgi:hypothetical protein
VFLFQNINFELFAPECSVPMGFWEKYYAKMLLLPGFAALLFCLLLARQFYKPNFDGRTTINSNDLLSKAQAQAYRSQQTLMVRLIQTKNLLVPMMFSTAVTLYTFLVSTSVSPFNCVSHYNDSVKKVTYIMSRNPSKACYDDEWDYHLKFVLIFAVVYGIFFPFIVAVVFFRNRKRIDDHHFQVGYGSLVFLYRRSFFFWELVSMLKRASFVIMTEFLNARQDAYLTKYTASISTVAFFSGLEAIYTPYTTKNLNLLSST